MFWKDQLAMKILAHADPSFQWLASLQSEFPSLRVKTIDAKGKVPVIQLNGKGEWMKPKEWALNHKSSLRSNYKELQLRLTLLGDDLTEQSSSQSSPKQLRTEDSNDLTDLNQWKQAATLYFNQYGHAMRAVKALSRGEKLSLELQQRIAKYDDSKPTPIF